MDKETAEDFYTGIKNISKFYDKIVGEGEQREPIVIVASKEQVKKIDEAIDSVNNGSTMIFKSPARATGPVLKNTLSYRIYGKLVTIIEREEFLEKIIPEPW